jgi:hypothetical protein
MITQDIRTNINKIDFDLKNLFESVKIEEKTSGNQFYFEIIANSTFVNESNECKRAQVIVNIDKRDLSSNFITWSYKSNPLLESSYIVERVSKIDTIANDIHNVIVEKRMDKDYLNSLEVIQETINESTVEVKEETLVEKLQSVLNQFGIETTKVENEITENSKTVRLFLEKSLKFSEMFQIESSFNSKPGVDWTVFKEGFIEVKYQ